MDNYQTGSVGSYDLLLDALDTFLTTLCGYTQNSKTSVGEPTGQRAHYQKASTHGTIYVNLKSWIKGTETDIWNTGTGVVGGDTRWNEIDGLGLNLSQGYNSGDDWNFQPGHPLSGDGSANPFIAVKIDGEGSIPTYWFFQKSSPELVVVAIEFRLGFYEMFAWGEVDKTGAGSYTGGQFFTGTSVHCAPISYTNDGEYPDSYNIYRTVMHPFLDYLRIYNYTSTTNYQHPMYFLLDSALHGGNNGWLGPTDSSSTSGTTYTGTGDYPGVGSSMGYLFSGGDSTKYPMYGAANDGCPARRSANDANLISAFMPIQLFWQPTIVDDSHVFLGTFGRSELFCVNMRDLEPQQVVTYGTDDYIILPFNQKIDPFQYDDYSVDSNVLRVKGQGMAVRTT